MSQILSVRSLSVALAVFSFSLAAYGQFQQPTQEELSMTADPKAPGAAVVYLYREEITDDVHHFRSVYARLKVLTEQGLDAATVHIPYQRDFVFYAKGENSSRFASASATSWSTPDINHSGEDAPVGPDNFNVPLDIGALEGRTIQPDGSIVPLSGSSEQLLKVTRDRSSQIEDITFTMPAVKVGSILEYRYQVRYDRYEQAPHWRVQQPYFVHKAHYSFLPAEQMLRTTAGGLAGGVTDSALTDSRGEDITDLRSMAHLPAGVQIHQEAGTGRYTLDLTDIPAISTEPFAPTSIGQSYEASFFYTVTPDQNNFWQREMNIWTKLLGGYTQKSQAVEHTVAQTVSPSDAPLDKAKKLYAFVQKLENTDFNSNGVPDIDSSWIPRGRVERVLETRKGSSNQLAYLYYALAREAGLDVRPLRIVSRTHRLFFDPTFTRKDQLDTVLISLTLDGKEILLDPGTKMAPFAELHWAHSGAGGITMSGNKVQIITTPLQKLTDNLALHVGTLNVSAQGALSGTLKVAYTGQQAIELRQLALRSNDGAVTTEVNRILASQVPQGVEAKVDHIAYLDDPAHQLLAVVNVSGTLPQQGGHVALPRAFFASHDSNPFPSGQRTEPIDIRYPSQDQEQITYVLPAGMALPAKPEDASFKLADNAIYSLKAKVEANQIISTRVLARGFTFLDPKEYGTLSDFYQHVVTADQQQIPLSGGKG